MDIFLLKHKNWILHSRESFDIVSLKCYKTFKDYFTFTLIDIDYVDIT